MCCSIIEGKLFKNSFSSVGFVWVLISGFTSVKKSFFKISLQFHPDRCSDKSKINETTEKFQLLNRAYSILSDPEKRAVYDETGVIDFAEEGSDKVDWAAIWKQIFKRVTVVDIENFLGGYRGSDQEREAVKEAYNKHKGNIGKIIRDVLGATYEDEDRLRNVINEMIEAGELEPMRNFTHEPAKKKARRRKAAEREAKEAEGALRQIKANEERERRLSNFDAFCDSLAEKYGKKRKVVKAK